MTRDFNEGQKNAITHKKGPAMVLAGPGSGKTLVITCRVRWLIEQEGVHPSNILVITFTRAAAEEMRRRFYQFEGMDQAQVQFGTFHSVFFMMLRYAYRYNGSNILKEHVKRQYLKDIISQTDLELEDENEFISGVMNEIGYVKGEMIPLSVYHSNNCSDELFQAIYEQYDQRLRRERMLDFDDMMVFCYELLRQRPDILAMWQKRFQYILIDEFQDINKVQYEIVKMLAGEQKNLFIVGDDDQSIYRFRGSRPEIMLGFEKDYPETKKIILDVNYRSSLEIVEASDRLIRHNEKRFVKCMKSARGAKVPVVYRHLANVSEECTDIIKGIQFYYKKGIPLEQMSVIFRTNTQPRMLVGRMMEYNIPFQMRDVLPNIFEHWIGRDLIAYMKLAAGDRDRALMLQVMNRPKRYISRSMIKDSKVSFADLKQETFGKRWLYEKIDKFEMDLYLMRKMDPYAAIQFIRNGIGYEDYLSEYAQLRKMNPEDLIEILNQIQESAKEYSTAEEWFDYIETYGQELQEQQENGRNQEKTGVVLTTMHSSKGLEYDVVFIMDVDEGVTPHKKAVKEADLEEERRLFYVALTRAKTYLFLYSVDEMYQKKVRTSRYINEIRVDPNRLQEGVPVHHERFGDGKIRKLEGDKVTVEFVHPKKVRRFSLDFVLEKNILKVIDSDPESSKSGGS